MTYAEYLKIVATKLRTPSNYLPGAAAELEKIAQHLIGAAAALAKERLKTVKHLNQCARDRDKYGAQRNMFRARARKIPALETEIQNLKLENVGLHAQVEYLLSFVSVVSGKDR